jgi:TPR repeat protein
MSPFHDAPMSDHPIDGQPLGIHSDLLHELWESRKGWDAWHWQADQEMDQQAEGIAYADRLEHDAEIDAEIAEVLHRHYRDIGDQLCKDFGLEATKANLAECYRLAAEEGIGDRQCQIADRYRDGDDIRQSHEEAAYWYGRAANQGSLRAMREMVVICTLGRGVPRDLKAAKAYQHLAEVVAQVS